MFKGLLLFILGAGITAYGMGVDNVVTSLVLVLDGAAIMLYSGLEMINCDIDRGANKHWMSIRSKNND